MEYEGRFGEAVFQCNETLKFNSSPFSWSYFKRLKSLLKINPPDIIFLHLPHPFAHEICKWFSSDLKKRNIKVVGIYHSDIINQVNLKNAYNYHFRRHLGMYDKFISSSDELRKSSAILSLLEKDKVKIIPFCIDNKNFKRSSRNSENFSGRFLSIGRMVPYKGFEFLVDSFKSSPYTLTIIGDGPLLKQLKDKAGPNVTFVGNVNEEIKYQLLDQHDALIVSSINRAEAYGMIIVEAFSMGLPVISSDIDTGVSFLVREGKTGLKFPVNDKEMILKQMDRLAKDSSFRKKISENCLEFYSKELNYEAFRKNIDNHLASLC